MKQDFIYLNVSRLIKRNVLRNGIVTPIPEHRENTLEWIKISLEFYEDKKLLKKNAVSLNSNLEDIVLKFSDFNAIGQEFIMSQQVDKWLAAWDQKRNKNPDLIIKPEKKKLELRFEKFMKKRFNQDMPYKPDGASL